MKNKFVAVAFGFFLVSTFSCGECTQCVKTGEQNLTYCEADFLNKQQYQSQIQALDSLGYTCSVK